MAAVCETVALKKFDVCEAHPAREMVDERRAATLLGPLETTTTELGSVIEEVKLSNKSYSSAAASVMAEKLQALPSVTSVDVSDVIAGRPEAEALEVLAALSGAFKHRAAALKSVDVSDNALGQKGMDALLPLFSANAALSAVRVCNNGMSAAAARQLAELLQGADQLETFHFHNNMSGDEGAEAIASIVSSSLKLRDLKFSGTRAGREGSLAVARALKREHTQLESLDLLDNTLSDEGGEALAQYIEAAAPPLRYLDLRDCALGPEGWAVVARALSPGANDPGQATAYGLLEHLDVSGNDLDAESCACLLALFRAQPRLAVLFLDENDLQVKGLSVVVTAISQARPEALVSLSLACNDINARTTPLALAKVLLDYCPLFSKLNLDGNGVARDAVDALSDLLGDKLQPLDDNDDDAIVDDDDQDPGDDLSHILSGLDISASS